MNAENKGILSLKVRSKSMPIVSVLTKPSHIQKMKHHKSKVQEQLQYDLLHNKHIFDLQNIKDQQAQQINTKIKVLAERSMKKLQERYETIDKWKQKYVPQSSIMLIRQKLSLDNHFMKINMEENGSQSSQAQQLQTCIRQRNQLFPIIIKKQIAPTIPDQRQQGKRLQELLRERLERNKKYYELKSTIIEKQINYFQEMNTFIAPQKKRELQLRKLLLKSQRDRATNKGLVYQKLSLSEPKQKIQIRSKNLRLLMQRQKSKYNDQKEARLKKSPSDIYDLKAKLMEEVVGTTPQGWDTVNQLDSPEDQDLS